MHGEATAGSYGQRRVSAAYGGTLGGIDLMLAGSVGRRDGTDLYSRSTTVPTRTPAWLPTWTGSTTELKKQGAAVVYLAPLRAIDIATVATSITRASVITMTGVPEYAARAAGADFSAQLLKLAELVE